MLKAEESHITHFMEVPLRMHENQTKPNQSKLNQTNNKNHKKTSQNPKANIKPSKNIFGFLIALS